MIGAYRGSRLPTGRRALRAIPESVNDPPFARIFDESTRPVDKVRPAP
jgi:hypothetical protein